MKGLVAAAVAVATLVPGCLDPFAVRVHPDALARAGWSEADGGRTSASWIGPRFHEVRYQFRGTATGPYAGELVVLSVRAAGPIGTEGLLERAQEAIAERAAEHGVELHDLTLSGTRRTAQGIPTHWVVREGTTREPGSLFPDEVSLRVLAEVGEDGATRTAFVVVGYVQVSRQPDCGILTCSARQDLRTWSQLAGDPDGSIRGARSDDGLVWRLVTH